MPIRKRGPGWQVDVKVRGRRARQTVATKALAIELEAKLRDDLQRQRHGLAVRRTLDVCLLEYLEGPARSLKSYESLIHKSRMLRPYLVGRPVEHAPEIAADIVRDDAGAKRAAATTNRTLALLRRLCSLEYITGRTASNIGQRIKLLPERNERHFYLEADKVEELCAWLLERDRQGEADAVKLAAYTGLRRGELFRLGPGDYLDGVLRVSVGKSGKPRLVPVPPPALEVCDRLPLHCTRTTLSEWWQKARVACGVPWVVFHDLRHTYASWLVQAGVDLRVVKELLGHSTMQVTVRYAHLADAQLRHAVSQIGSRQGHKAVKRTRRTAPK